MCEFGKPSNGGNAFRMPLPRMNVRFWQETLRRRDVAFQIDSNVLRRMQKVSALVIEGILD